MDDDGVIPDEDAWARVCAMTLGYERSRGDTTGRLGESDPPATGRSSATPPRWPGLLPIYA